MEDTAQIAMDHTARGCHQCCLVDGNTRVGRGGGAQQSLPALGWLGEVTIYRAHHLHKMLQVRAAFCIDVKLFKLQCTVKAPYNDHTGLQQFGHYSAL